MKTALFSIPIKPGKLEAYKAFITQCTGPKRVDNMAKQPEFFCEFDASI